MTDTPKFDIDPMLEGFQLLNYSENIDFDTHIAKVPRDGTVKGMFFSDLINAIRACDPPKADELPFAKRRHLPFNDYPMREYFRLVEHAVAVIHPNLPSAEGVRQVAWGAFPRFVDSAIGRVVVGIFLDDMDRLVGAMAKAFQYTSNLGTVNTEKLGDKHWHYHIRDTPGAIRQFMVGAAEGIFRHRELEYRVMIREIGPASYDLSIQWV